MRDGLRYNTRRIWRDGKLIEACRRQHGPRAGGQAWTGHSIDLRASVPLPSGRWYVTIVASRERRNSDRLREEGQTHWLRRATVYVMLMSLALWLVVCAIVAVYLIKSALSLDLFDGSSPLHLLYDRWFGSRA